MTHTASRTFSRGATLCALAAVVVAAKLPTIRTPAYWDEIGWITQAHWLSEHSLVAVLPGFRAATVFSGHPAGLHLLLVGLSRLFGFSVALAHLVAVSFSALGVGFVYLLGEKLYDRLTGMLAALFLLTCPVYFAQSGMFLADLPVAALGVMSAYFVLEDRDWLYVCSATAMVLIKETGAAVAAALLIFRMFEHRSPSDERRLRLAKCAIPLVVIACFLAWQRAKTGEIAFILDPDQYEASLFQWSPTAIVQQVRLITGWLFVAQGRWLVSIVLAAAAAVHPSAIHRRWLWLLALICLLSGYTFAVLYYVPRYILPVLPFLYLLGAGSLRDLIKPMAWRAVAGAALVGISVWSLAHQSFWGSAEFNMRYLDVVGAHQDTARSLSEDDPAGQILTVWPLTAELERPFLGYVDRPVRTIALRPHVNQRPADLEPVFSQADFILVSTIPETPGMQELRTYAITNGWRLERKSVRHEVMTELFARPQ